MSLNNLNNLKSNATAVDDSGTESGEEVNQKILVQVQGALANLESALPALDPLRRSSVVELLTKLQTSLKLSTDKKPTPPPRKCWNHKKTAGGRQDRHTVGVSSEELQDARRWLEENGYADVSSTVTAPAANPVSSACSTPRSYDASATKTFRPVKFVPPPPKRTHYAEDYIPEPSKRSLQNSSFTCPPAQHAVVVDSCPIGGGVDRRRRRGASSSNERDDTTDSSGGDVTSADDDEDDTDDDRRSVSSAQRLLRIASCNDIGRKFRQGKRAKLKQRPGTGDRDDRDHSSGDDCHGGGRGQKEPVANRVPPFEPKTASDKKYLALMRHTKQNDDALPAAAAGAYNPLNGKLQGNWGNRFGRIKTAFERGATATAAAVESPKKSLAKAFWHDICKCPSEDSIAYRSKSSSSSSFRPAWTGENGFSHGTRSAFKPVAPHKVFVPFSAEPSLPAAPTAPQPVAAPVRPKPDHPKHLPLYNSSVATAHRPFIYTSPDRPAEDKSSPWSLTSPSELTTTSCSASPLADYDAPPTTATSRVMGSPQTANIVKSKTCHRSPFPSPTSPHVLPGPPFATAAPRYPSLQPQPPIHYNAPAPVVQAAPRPPPRSPRPVRQQRSPTSSPVRMPSVLQKSESWHQMIMGQSKAAARLPVAETVTGVTTTRHMAAPYQGYLPREQIARKQNIVRQHLQAGTTGSSGTSSSKCVSPRLVKLNDDIDKVDDTFESLFKEATKAK